MCADADFFFSFSFFGVAPNIALGKPTAQSSTGWNGFSQRAVDGLIEVEQKFVRIIDINGLKQIFAHRVT